MKKVNKIILLFLLVVLPSCQSLNLLAPAPQIPSPSITLSATLTATITATATEPLTPTLTPTFVPQVRRVMILSIDGLRPDVISLASMPNLLNLMQASAY